MRGNTLVLDANRGATATVNGRAVTAGDAQGRLQVTDVEGNTTRVRQPVYFDAGRAGG